MSTDYYVRLEQGRERNPSPQVLRALAAALLLEDEEAAYLRAIVDPPQRGRPRPALEHAGPQLVSLLDTWADTPALVYGRYLDLLAVNSLGEALFSWLAGETSLITAMFLAPAAQDFYRDWTVVAQGCVAALRAANPDPGGNGCRSWWVNSPCATPTSPVCGRVTRYGPRRPWPNGLATPWSAI